jgi:hypothetical protein
MYMSQELVLIEPGEAPVAQVVTVRTNAGLEGNMETIGEHRAHPGSINLVILKREILSALSAVGSATTGEELEQADAAYKKLSAPLEAWAIVRTSEQWMADKFKWTGWP